MNKLRNTLLIALVFALLIPSIGFAAQDQSAVEKVIGQMPADTRDKEHELDEKLLEMAPASVQRICSKLVPEGQGGVSARYAINSLVAYCSAEGREKHKSMLEKTILEAIPKAGSPEVKVFLVDQLCWIVSDRSVPVLSKMLGNERLCDPAARALTTLGTRNAEQALIEALPHGQESQKISIIKALGQLESKKAAKLIREYADTENSTLKEVSLFALANIGQKEDVAIFQKAIKAGSQHEKNTYAAYYLHFAKRLSQNGDKDESIEICQNLFETGNEINPGLQSAALSAWVDVQGAKAFPRLVYAMKDGGEFLQGTAMQLANSFTDKKYIKIWGVLLPKVSESAQLKIIRFLGESGSESATATLRSVVKSGNKKLVPSAVDALIRLNPSNNAEFLFSEIENMGVSVREKLELFSRIAPFAKTPQEKKALIDGLAKLDNMEALEMVARLIDDADVSSEASLAAVAIALPEGPNAKPLTNPAVADILSRASQNIDSPKIRQEAMELVAKVKQMHGLEDQIPSKNDPGFAKLFNGKDFSGWQGLLKKPYDNPYKRAELSQQELEKLQKEANANMREHWSIKDGVLVFDGKGRSIVTKKEYGNFEMFVDWKINARGDSGLYLRGFPQVQIWDPNQWKMGSGGLYNNKKNSSKPLEQADNPIGEWNTFYIKMVGDKVTVYLNGTLVVDNVPLENYWDRSKSLPQKGPIEIQAHGNKVWFKEIYVRELKAEKVKLPEAEKKEGFQLLFNGVDLEGWQGNIKAHVPENGILKYDPKQGGGNLYTDEQYGDFIFRFEFKLTPGANNGLGIRTPRKGDPAYVGMELQILDNTAPKYANLKPYQYHGSVYGIIPAELGRLRPVGQWNEQEVIVNGRDIKIILNGETIVDGNLDEASKGGTMDGKNHPGLKRDKGYICFCSHGSLVYFRNIRIKKLD